MTVTQIESQNEIVCFQTTPPPQNTTPFPTRRSSDLIGAAGPARARELHGISQDLFSDRHLADEALELEDRSEEHTSELQSRFDLVCRLLLEKKNTNRACWHSCGAFPPDYYRPGRCTT